MTNGLKEILGDIILDIASTKTDYYKGLDRIPNAIQQIKDYMIGELKQSKKGTTLQSKESFIKSYRNYIVDECIRKIQET